MWIEPLTATAEPEGEFAFRVAVQAGDASPIASVRCPINAAAGFGYFGEMLIADANGAPRQRLRALTLLVREALRFAAENGITAVRTDVPERLQRFAQQISGVEPQLARGERNGVIAGELHAIRSFALRISDADGNIADTAP